MTATRPTTPFEKLKGCCKPTLSYEVFPPRNPQGWATLYSTLGEVLNHHPDFVSVTYGASGSTREKTVSLVGRIQTELSIETIPHLTCVGHTRDQLAEVLDALHGSGMQAIIALRGDPPQGEDHFVPHASGLAHASDLIRLAKERCGFAVGCACYPEKHPEASNLDEDIGYLKLKQDNGADFAITQLFFDNEDFYRFRDRAQSVGVTIPIIAGIMPVRRKKQLARFQRMCGCSIPTKLIGILEDAHEDEVAHRGIEYGIAQCDDLLRHEAAGIHLYTLNKSNSSMAITTGLRARGHFNEPYRSIQHNPSEQS